MKINQKLGTSNMGIIRILNVLIIIERDHIFGNLYLGNISGHTFMDPGI